MFCVLYYITEWVFGPPAEAELGPINSPPFVCSFVHSFVSFVQSERANERIERTVLDLRTCFALQMYIKKHVSLTGPQNEFSSHSWQNAKA